LLVEIAPAERIRHLDRRPTLPELRRRAAAEAVAAARAYFEERVNRFPPWHDTRHVLVAGHQPELFHPGVWVKNFALHELARRTGATPLNLIVDNDLAKTTALRVPVLSGDPARVRLVSVPFDHWAGEVPYEERVVHDETLFASLPERVGELTVTGRSRQSCRRSGRKR